jgi:hypothetical protein
MTEQVLSYLITGIGLIGFWLAGKKIWWCWWVNVANQILWTVFAVVTGYYAFLIGTAFYFVVFTKNAIQWTRDHFKEEEKTQRLLPKVTFSMSHADMKRSLDKSRAEVGALQERLDQQDAQPEMLSPTDIYKRTKDLLNPEEVEDEPILVGQDGHICHASPIPGHTHSYRCPNGEHPTGWRHNQGPHKSCNVCR